MKKKDVVYDGASVTGLKCDNEFCYAIKALPTITTGSAGSTMWKINKSDGAVMWWNWRSWLNNTWNASYGTGAKLINAGQTWNTQITCDNINTVGDYWFKVLVYYGTEVSGASRLFAATSSSAPVQQPSQGGQQGAAAATGAATAPAAPAAGGGTGQINVVDYPKVIDVKTEEAVTTEIKVVNSGNGTLHNVRLNISGLPAGMYSISPAVTDIAPGAMQSFLVTIQPGTEEVSYSPKFTLMSDEAGWEQSFNFNVKKPEVSVMSTEPIGILSGMYATGQQIIALVGVEPQVWIIVLAMLVVVVVILLRERRLQKELDELRNGMIKRRSRREIDDDIARARKHLHNLDVMHSDGALDHETYDKSKTDLLKRIEKLKDELAGSCAHAAPAAQHKAHRAWHAPHRLVRKHRLGIRHRIRHHLRAHRHKAKHRR